MLEALAGYSFWLECLLSSLSLSVPTVHAQISPILSDLVQPPPLSFGPLFISLARHKLPLLLTCIGFYLSNHFHLAHNIYLLIHLPHLGAGDKRGIGPSPQGTNCMETGCHYVSDILCLIVIRHSASISIQCSTFVLNA